MCSKVDLEDVSLMKAAQALRRNAAGLLRDLDLALDLEYAAPESELGNKSDPLDEAIYIILSFQTDITRLSRVWSALRKRYPTWEELEGATLTQLARVIREGGLHRQKAQTIISLLGAVRRLNGGLSLRNLTELSGEEAERVLLKLPGLSWKGARCVLLYSLGKDVLPIDGNTFRILKRVGALHATAVYRRKSLHDQIQAAVPVCRRRAFHVNLVVHGRRTCLPTVPQCSRCPLASRCARHGLANNGHATVVEPRTVSRLGNRHSRVTTSG